MIKLPEEKKIIWYGSLAVALVVNLPRLSALRGNSLLSQYTVFSPMEYIFQLAFNFLFCYLVLAYNMGGRTQFKLRPWQNLLLLLVATATGIFVQRTLFPNAIPRKIYRGAYLARFFICMVVELLVVRNLYLLREARTREVEAEQAKMRFLKAELELMKQQLNPHFFFNSLSTLSGMVREDPVKAQRFIGHLSKIFRNLLQANRSLVTVKEELQELEAYTELLKMRFENSIHISVNIDEAYMNRELPHLSLQPLIENAAKHNKATAVQPLYIQIEARDNALYVQNNLQPLGFAQEQSGTGLFNLSERYRMLQGQEIAITRTDFYFVVVLPFN